jgi:hypothetical protein
MRLLIAGVVLVASSVDLVAVLAASVGMEHHLHDSSAVTDIVHDG